MREIRLMFLFCLLMIASGVNALTLRLATQSPDGSAWMVSLRKAAATIAQETSGRVVLKFYTGGTMGSDRTVLSKIRIGELQGGALTLSSMDSVVHDTDLYSLPMLFRNEADVDRVRRVMDPMLSRELEEAGWINFGFAEGGFVYLFSHKDVVTTQAQLRAHKVWIPEGDRFSSTAFRMLGVSPVPLSLGDVLPGLQTGIVDVVAGSPIAVLALQWQSALHSVTDVPISYLCGVLTISKKDFERIAPADQLIVRRVMTATFQALDQANRRDNQAAYQALLHQGILPAHPTAADLQQWRQLSQTVTRGLVQQGFVSAAAVGRVQSVLAGGQ